MKKAFTLLLTSITLIACADQDKKVSRIFTPGGGSDPSEGNKKTVESFYYALEKNQPELLEHVMIANVKVYDSGEPLDSLESRYDIMNKNIPDRMKALHEALPGLKIDVIETIAEGKRVFVRASIRGTQKGSALGILPTMKPINIKTYAIFTLQDDKIVEIQELWNELAVMKQMGYIAL